MPFTSKTRFRGSTENLHVVERFTRADDKTLLYSFHGGRPGYLVQILDRRVRVACHLPPGGCTNTLVTREITRSSIKVEGGSQNTLLRRGANKNTLPEGTEVVVDGYQARENTEKRANARNVTFPDSTISVRSLALLAPLVLINPPGFHHELDVTQSFHILPRVSLHRDNVGEMRLLNRARTVRPPQ